MNDAETLPKAADQVESGKAPNQREKG